MTTDRRRADVRYDALHLCALWAIAVAQPIYDTLHRNPEFFVAHRATPLDIGLLVVVLSAAMPLALWSVRWAAGRASARAGAAVQTAIVAVLVALIASYMIARTLPLPALWHTALAATAGAAFGWLYRARQAGRLFATLLAPAVLLCPAVFLMQPRMAPLLSPHDPTKGVAAALPGTPFPIVFVIFDQLPLISLMDGSGAIDAQTYPGFAQLASDSTWYRNASTVGDLTGWAVPAILSGVMPRPDRLPTLQHHPGNLFTYLGERYRYEVIEPITHLCPDRLCPPEQSRWSERLAGMVMDTSVVFLHAIAPASLRVLLPPLTDNWKNFIDAQGWQRRWVRARDADRRQSPLDFIDGISRADPQPTLYFLHALLPHEPYLYFRTGQQFADGPRLVGLTAVGRWTRDEWPVLQAWQRELAQVRFVDDLLGRLIARLKQEGLYDQALIVVTGDHGVSFRPGNPFKGVSNETFPDIMSVPLFLKRPHQHDAAIDDRNAQSVDIVPTIAALLGTPPSWPHDGHSLLGERADEPLKTLYHTGATRRFTVEPGQFTAARERAVARRLAIFRHSPHRLAPALDVDPGLVGQPLASLHVEDDGPTHAVMSDPDRFEAVDLSAPTVPSFITGRVFDDSGGPMQAMLAIAVNGTIAGTTRTYPEEPGAPAGSWVALLDPKWLRAGRNRVEVLAVERTRDAVTLQRAYAMGRVPETVNVSSRAAEEFWSVDQRGMYDREGDDGATFRWTDGDATMAVPLNHEAPPRSMRVRLSDAANPSAPVRVSVNDCVVFAGRVPALPWQRTFSLRSCPPSALRGDDARVEVQSAAVDTRGPDGRTRKSGVAIAAVNLYDDDWPPPHDPAASAAGLVRVVESPDAPRHRGDVLPLEIVNAGDTIWPDASESEADAAVVDVVLRWKSAGAARTGEQRLALPYAMYPSDRWRISIPLVPPPDLEPYGPWTVEIEPGARSGVRVPVRTPCLVHVLPERGAEAGRVAAVTAQPGR